MINRSVEMMAFEIGARVTDVIPYRYFKTETFVSDKESEDVKSLETETARIPSLIVSRLEVQIEDKKNAVMHLMHYPRKGILQVYLGTDYSDLFRTEAIKFKVENSFSFAAAHIYRDCVRLSRTTWETYLSSLFLDYGIELSAQPFALRIVDIQSEQVRGDKDIRKVLDYTKLVEVICKTIQDMMENKFEVQHEK